MVWFVLALARFTRIVRSGLQDPESRALLIIFALLLAIGTGFYTAVEDWSVIDALYFCVVSLGTVGYGDVAPTTDEGKLFTIVYLLIGIGVFVALAGKFAAELLKERERSEETDEGSG
ncbi:MAG TPA: potassium channel family protein [Dehalococcoidia bacterium]|nr:potassium channel family protein [Dehalococcoidia bacterium]